MLILYSRVAKKYPFELPHALRDAGYYTFGIGKMHFHPQRNTHGYHQTLLDESSRGILQGFVSDYRRWFKQQAPNLNPDVTGIGWNDYRSAPYALPEELHPTTWTANTAVNFIEKYNTELGKQCQGVTEEGMRTLMGHEWKGNIRELENVIERSIIFSEEDLIDVKNLGLLSPYVDAIDGADDNLQNTLKAFEKQHILRVLKKHNYDKTQASRALGVGLSSLYRKMDELDIRVARTKL